MLVLFSALCIHLYYSLFIVLSPSPPPQIQKKFEYTKSKVSSQSLVIKFEKQWKKGEWPQTQKEYKIYIESIIKKRGPHEALQKY